MNLCACSKFWVVVPRTSTKAHCYAIDAAPGKLDPFFCFCLSWRCWTKHGTASRFAVNTQRWIIAFMPTAQGLALHGFISFRMRQEIHRPSGCLEIIVQVCLFALQFETATGSACATLASVCRVVQISHDRRLKNQWVSLASSLDEQLDGKGQEVPTLKFMIHQSALSNALEKCNP